MVDMAEIHPSAIVHPKAELAEDVQVGPFCVIGAGVQLGKGCILHNHVTLDGPSTFGEYNEFFPYCFLGGKSQDLKYKGEPTYLEVGHHNVFREYSTVNRATSPGDKTIVGNYNHMLVSSHMGHDCKMGDNVIMSGYAGVAGHVEIGDYAIVSGAAIVHQFVRIGEHSRVGGGARVSQDVPPYMITEGHPAIVRAINTIGLQRRGFAEEDIRALKLCYRKLFLHKDTIISEAIETLLADEQYGKNPCLLKLIDFLQTSKRGFGH
jgi:UDP-N-acetylglucosamine acyltransferase